MLHRPEPARRGITLLEVLAAIFIMGIGLLALLTLFPLGALSMARAVREDRAAAIGANAGALAAALDLRNDPNFVDATKGGNLLSDQYAPAGFAKADPDGPGYPVLVDPSYVVLGQTTLPSAPPANTPGLLRIAPSYATNTANIARWFSFLEEIKFEKTGQPTGAGASVERPGTYTWSYLLRRPRSSSPDLVEMSVLVYATRAVDTADGEAVYTVAGTKGGTTMTLTYPAGAKPNLRRGAWIMDVTYVALPGGFGTVNGYTYQIQTVTDVNATTLSLEVDPAIKTIDPAPTATVNTIVVLENVIAVIDRSTTWKP